MNNSCNHNFDKFLIKTIMHQLKLTKEMFFKTFFCCNNNMSNCTKPVKNKLDKECLVDGEKYFEVKNCQVINKIYLFLYNS